MIDFTRANPRLAAQFIARAKSAEKDGCASGSMTEQMVSALLNNRADWLPEGWTILEAIERLHLGGEDWFPTMMAVNRRGWQDTAVYEERL